MKQPTRGEIAYRVNQVIKGIRSRRSVEDWAYDYWIEKEDDNIVIVDEVAWDYLENVYMTIDFQVDKGVYGWDFEYYADWIKEMSNKEEVGTHILLSIEETTTSRVLELGNLVTFTTGKFFDDTSMDNNNNFNFMEIGNTYACKIKLFGAVVVCDEFNEEGEYTLECKIVNKDVLIGKYLFVEVLVGKDIYYIYKEDINSILSQNEFLYRIRRKEILQVNDVICSYWL